MSNTFDPNKGKEMDDLTRMLTYIPKVGEIFNVLRKIGEGTFSKVFQATVKGDNSHKEYALKYIVPTSRPSRIANELRCLKEVGGSCCVISAEVCLMENGHVVIVMPYIPHERFTTYMKLMTFEEVKDYMTNLFIALAKVHAHGIIHRDIKPNNFLVDRINKRYVLVDFGLAQRASDLQKSSDTTILSSKNSRPPLSERNGLMSSLQVISDEKAKAFETPKPRVNLKNEHLKGILENSPQLTPISRKRMRDSNQENKDSLHPSKKVCTFSTPAGCWQALSPRVNILPTPPDTPLRKLPAKHTVSEPKRKKMGGSQSQLSCSCYGRNFVCKICLGRPPEEAPRGGTPGFRAPEVLLKHKAQTTAIDMWSAGVILLSFISKKYPFFRAEDDLSALSEVVLLTGSKRLKEAACSIGKKLTVCLPKSSVYLDSLHSTMTSASYLKKLCAQLCNPEASLLNSKSSSSQTCLSSSLNELNSIPDSAFDLLSRLLDPNPATRITASEALQHPFITGR